MKDVLYVAFTNDKYELPYAVADNLAELSEMVGTVTPKSISKSISMRHAGTRFGGFEKIKYRKGELKGINY